MKKLKPEETILTGKWLIENGQIVGDETNDRIKDLIKFCLIKIKSDPSGWDSLYKDPSDERYWELTYPHSDWQGGGPLQLRLLSLTDLKEKYEIGE